VRNILFYFYGETLQLQLGRQIIEVSGTHKIRHKHAHPVGFLLKCYQLATCKHKTNTRNLYPCPQRDSKPRSQQWRDLRPKP